MGHSQDDKVRSRERILTVASRRFREAGLDGLSIADLMKRRGLASHTYRPRHTEYRDQLLPIRRRV